MQMQREVYKLRTMWNRIQEKRRRKWNDKPNQQKYWAGKGHKVAKVLKEGDAVGSFTVNDTSGQSKCHISFFRETDRVMIVGDVLVNMNLVTTIVGLHQPPNLFTTDNKKNIESIKKIAGLKRLLISKYF